MQTVRSSSRTLFLCTFFFLAHILSAQEAPPPPIEWGEISKADLEMTSFPSDTNASAVILCDYGESRMNDYMDFVYTRHLRVKILNQKGFEWGTHSITVNTDRDNGETVDDIEGMTYSLDEKGKVVETEFDDDDVFEEKINENFARHKFTLPGLKPGCVIEIRYEITIKSLWNVRDWTFQHSEPVLWSEYRFQYPASIGFTFLTRGYEPFAVNERTGVMQYFSGEALSFVGTPLARCYLQRFVVKNTPALRDEPYITTLKDYYSTVEVQFSGYADRGTMSVKHVMETWDVFIKEMLESRGIGQSISSSSKVKELTESVTRSAANPEAKVRAIYDWITSSIEWNGSNRNYASQSADEIIASRKGNSAEINLLLISMLRAAGFQSDPVILSTRENGTVQEMYPIISQFNYLVARVMIGSSPLFLDACDPHRPMELLPTKILGVRGLVLEASKVEWVKLYSKPKSSTVTFAQLTLDENGSVTGTVEGLYRSYAAVGIRSKLDDNSELETAQSSFSTETSGLTIDSVNVSGKDSVLLPLRLKAWVSSPTFAQSGDGILYLNPHILGRITDNPFKSANRRFPVDYGYPREFSSTVLVQIPRAYQIKEGLKNITMSIADGVSFRRLVSVDSANIQVVTKLDITSPVIPASEYQRLKELYASIVALESEQLVLESRPVIAPPPPAAEAPKVETQVLPAAPVKKKGKKK